jgi:hypothetical protein
MNPQQLAETFGTLFHVLIYSTELKWCNIHLNSGVFRLIRENTQFV